MEEKSTLDGSNISNLKHVMHSKGFLSTTYSFSFEKVGTPSEEEPSV